MVLGLALEDCASEVYKDPLEGYCGESGELWRHSLLTALASRELAKISVNKISR